MLAIRIIGLIWGTCIIHTWGGVDQSTISRDISAKAFSYGSLCNSNSIWGTLFNRPPMMAITEEYLKFRPKLCTTMAATVNEGTHYLTLCFWKELHFCYLRPFFTRKLGTTFGNDDTNIHGNPSQCHIYKPATSILRRRPKCSLLVWRHLFGHYHCIA